MNRRTALRTLGALAGAAAGGRLVPGCSSQPGSQLDMLSQPDMGPKLDPARVAQGLTTIVTLCMENRSYDHFFGARSLLEGRPGDGLTADMANARHDGSMVKVFHTQAPCIADPPHGWDAVHAQLGAMGHNDGFVTAYQDADGASIAPEVMGYVTRAELPVSYALADAGTVFDRWFCSMLGPTWPNRMYLHSAQSGGLTANVLPPGGFNWPSIYSRLNDAKVPWAYYFSTLPFVPLFSNLGDLSTKVKRVNSQFFNDAAAGILPPVVFIDPAFNVNDDHPPLPPVFGQQFIASIYKALASSPQWPNILFLITYDEHGGFFDHVTPPMAADDRADQGFGQLSFRVPTLALGPYVKPGALSSVVHDHTSVLAHIERMHGLMPLTKRDAAAADLSDALDMARLSAKEPLLPVQLPDVTVDQGQIDMACKQFQMMPATELSELADTGYFPPHWDRRADGPQILAATAERLRRR